MTETTWTDEAIDAAIRAWLPDLKADVYEAPALRGALHLALEARSTAAALEAWDRIAAQHAEQDPHRPELEDLAPYFDAEATRSPKQRTDAMAEARRTARQFPAVATCTACGTTRTADRDTLEHWAKASRHDTGECNTDHA